MVCFRILIFTFCIAFCSLNNLSAQNKKNICKRDSLAFELSKMYGGDQTIRLVNMSKETVMVMKEIDSLNFIRIIDFIKKHGYPNEKLLGEVYKEYESVCMAAPAILLHNPSRVVQKPVFDLLKKEVEKGNMKPEALAMILDKYYVYHKGYSLYHTQFKKAIIENKEIVNKARLEIGLSILPDSVFIDNRK